MSFADLQKEVLFDEQEHKYTDPSDGAVIPSTTTISSLLQVSGDYSKVPNIKWYADRGTLAHYALEMYISIGDKDTAVAMAKDIESEYEASWEDAEPFFESGVKFIDENKGLKISETERQFLHNIDGMRYAGTIDVVGELNGNLTVLDWKTSKDIEKESYKLQIGAYAEKMDASKGYVIKLKDDGTMAEILLVDVEVYRKKWRQILEIFYSEGTDDEKVTKAKSLILERVMLDKKRADKIIKAKEALDKAKAEYDEVKKDIGDILDKHTGEYADDRYKIMATYKPESTTEKVNTKELIKAVSEHIGKDLLDEIVKNCTTVSAKAGFYTVTVKEVKTDDEKPEPEKTTKKKSQPKKTTKKKAEPDVENEEKATVPEKSADDNTDSTVEEILRSKGIEDDELVRVFWITVEELFGCSKDIADFDMDGAKDIAREITKETLEQYSVSLKDGGVICPKAE